jgi:prepilin-type N-terminal cleavage/methylation domain-containing protein/prepilin-type processing-associated H-X9-DG protein
MERKAFTLVELLVVIAIIALLMGILMPALSRVRQIAFRLVCGTNLSGIGKAMLIYANDYDNELPRAGGPTSVWGGPIAWDAENRFQAFGLGSDSSGGQASITSCFYLLVKYAEVTPKSFICKGDAGVTEFKLADYLQRNAACEELIDAWDFGGGTTRGQQPSYHCSYSYHQPFGMYALTTASEPAMAVAADRNPWINSPAAEAKTWGGYRPDMAPWNGTTDEARYGNAIAHQEDGQNVLFLDGHVNFEDRAYCGVEEDNIYTLMPVGGLANPQIGEAPVACTSEPGNRADSLLVNDPKEGCGSGVTTTTH